MPSSKTTRDLPTSARIARLFRNGRNQALRIPREFELAGDEVIIHKQGDRLIVEPILASSTTLAALLASWTPLNESIANVDEGLFPLDDIEL